MVFFVTQVELPLFKALPGHDFKKNTQNSVEMVNI